MNFFRELISLNHAIIIFGYGLIFFVVGLAIALQSRSYSRLDLARSLSWLSAFGFAHGFYEWGDLFIPIQAAYLSASTIQILHYFHLLLLALSFTFLFEFGVTLLNPLGWARWLHSVSAGLLAMWVFAVYFPLPLVFRDFSTWHNVADALARYFIGLPGGLLAAYGLRKHTVQRIAPLNVPHIVKMLKFAGIMLAIYGFLGGLIPPPVPFFPGNLINSAILEQVTGAPPPLYRSLIGLGLAFAIIRALEVFDVETGRMIEAMKHEQILAAERERIARELHDGAIQKVYTAGLLIESAQKYVPEGDERLAARLEKAVNVMNDSISDLRRNLSELHASPAEESLADGLHKLAYDPRYGSLVDVRLELNLPEGETLSPVRTGHVLAIVNEALSNAVRHSRPRKVKISARRLEERLLVSVEDDGSGMPDVVQTGYGLRNMHDRARLLGGDLEISGLDGRGTRVDLDIPWKEGR